MLPLLETFLELLLWNSFQCHHHFFSLETARSHLEPNQGKGWVFHLSNQFLGQKLLAREHLMSWSIIMVENSIVGPKFRPFSTHKFM
jgi:hypothetical protein